MADKLAELEVQESVEDPFASVSEGDGDPTAEEIEDWATLDTPSDDEGHNSHSATNTQPERGTLSSVSPVPTPQLASPATNSAGDGDALKISTQAAAATPASASPSVTQEQVKVVASPVVSSDAADHAVSIPSPPSAVLHGSVSAATTTDASAPLAPTIAHLPVQIPDPAVQPSPSSRPTASASSSSPDDAPVPELQQVSLHDELLPQPISTQGMDRDAQPGTTADLVEDDDTAGGAWGGWGGWGIPNLGLGKLKQVAASAVRDVQEQISSLQQALAEVEDTTDEESSGARDDSRPTGSETMPLLREAAHTSSISTDAPQSEEINEVPDTQLEVGLKAIDDQVEQLASGAAKALTSLWGGLARGAGALVSQVEAATKEVASELSAGMADVREMNPVRGMTQLTSKLAERAERGLERVGLATLNLFGEVGWNQAEDDRVAEMDHEPQSFEDFLYIYGGQQLIEEVEEVANECARMVNKSRAKLEEDQKEQLDACMAQLALYFNGVSSPPAAELVQYNAEQCEEAAERLQSMYDPITYLCQDSAAKAELYLQQLLQSVRLTDIDEAASEIQPAPQDPPADVPSTTEVLAHMQLHMAKRMAELCTAQVQLLLNYAASLAAPARTGRPAPDGIAWPPDSFQQALLLRQEAEHMIRDLHAVTDGYKSTVSNFLEQVKKLSGSSLEPADSTPSATQGQLDVLPDLLQAQARLACSHVEEGTRGLLYAVVLRRLVSDIAV